mmetsp:Transcript_114952/g.245462  ORF Transcript_114952/g.245462 Transcript_114952/m.245462 type:complete len:242 (+) Transcript_114952:64-789(+)
MTRLILAHRAGHESVAFDACARRASPRQGWPCLPESLRHPGHVDANEGVEDGCIRRHLRLGVMLHKGHAHPVRRLMAFSEVPLRVDLRLSRSDEVRHKSPVGLHLPLTIDELLLELLHHLLEGIRGVDLHEVVLKLQSLLEGHLLSVLEGLDRENIGDALEVLQAANLDLELRSFVRVELHQKTHLLLRNDDLAGWHSRELAEDPLNVCHLSILLHVQALPGLEALHHQLHGDVLRRHGCL